MRKFAEDYHGVLIESAEIIPIEPDADNAVAGIRYNLDKAPIPWLACLD